MKLNEIKIGGIYKTTLKVQFRSEDEVKGCDFFVKVTGKTSGGYIEVSFMGDNVCYFLNPCQVDKIE